MKKITIGVMLLFSGMAGLAQTKKSVIVDDLVKDKAEVMGRYLPMQRGMLLNRAYHISPADLISKVDSFKMDMNVQVQEEPDSAIKKLMLLDIYHYSNNLVKLYINLYGSDSLGMTKTRKILSEKRDSASFEKVKDSVYRLAYRKTLSEKEKEFMTNYTDKQEDMNNEALFKRSGSYRGRVNSYLVALIYGRYKNKLSVESSSIDALRLKVVGKEISNTFIREYLSYVSMNTLLKSGKSVSEIEEAYKYFLTSVKNPIYQTSILPVYENFKMISSNATAPNFTYADVDGKNVSLTDLRGKYVYIDVWATWCEPCKAEIPHLTELESDYHGKKIQFISLSVDKPTDRKKWNNFVKMNKLKGIQVMADKAFDSEFIQKFNINSIPRFILISPEGKILDGNAKRPSNKALKTQLDSLLKE